MKYYVYILYSPEHDTFYVGQTSNMNGRLTRHNSGQVRSTAPFVPWVSCVAIEKESRSEAVILERKLKNLSKARLRNFIHKYGGLVPPTLEK